MPRKEKQKLDGIRNLLDSRLLPGPLGVPQNEEARRIFFINLVRCKALRLTNQECADRLGVGESTIRKYLREQDYRDVHDELIGDSKDRGHFLISELLDDAMRVLHDLMLNAKSEFVRFKSVELVMESAGLKEPKDEVKKDARDGVVEFLKQVDEKRQAMALASTQVTGEMIVESLPAGVSPELAPYYQQVGPGGALPASFRAAREWRPPQGEE